MKHESIAGTADVCITERVISYFENETYSAQLANNVMLLVTS